MEGEADPRSEIEGIAGLRIHPGKLEEFKALQMQCMAIARSKDTGTLQYDVFFNEDGSECRVHERYRDSDALLEHLANLGETATALFQICSAEGEVLGTPSAKLRQALEGGPVRIFTPYHPALCPRLARRSHSARTPCCPLTSLGR